MLEGKGEEGRVLAASRAGVPRLGSKVGSTPGRSHQIPAQQSGWAQREQPRSVQPRAATGHGQGEGLWKVKPGQAGRSVRHIL